MNLDKLNILPYNSVLQEAHKLLLPKFDVTITGPIGSGKSTLAMVVVSEYIRTLSGINDLQLRLGLSEHSKVVVHYVGLQTDDILKLLTDVPKEILIDNTSSKVLNFENGLVVALGRRERLATDLIGQNVICVCLDTYPSIPDNEVNTIRNRISSRFSSNGCYIIVDNDATDSSSELAVKHN